MRVSYIMESRYKLLMMVIFLLTMSLRRSDGQLLPDEEVDALKVIASKLRYSGWQPTSNSCSTGTGLNQTKSLNDKGLLQFGSSVTCTCNTTVCHITNIQLKGLNLTGVIPEEFANLTSLRELDLTRNYLNGTIPERLGQLQLTILSILGNRISGPIPEEIGDISTLEELVVEDNLLGGELPQNIGRLTRLRRFRIDGSNLSGRIPDFIGNWTNIERLDLQGTSMEGPIPSTISLLTKMKELRITDLAGSRNFPFPNLQDMTKMKELSLRNCLLTGPIPEYIGEMTSMKNLDLSFNELTGPIPDPIKGLSFDTMFLNNNFLSGDIPGWIFSSKEKIDISYNNFTRTQPRTCQSSRLNLVSALSSSAAYNKDAWCLSDQLTCSRNPNHHSLFINCGGTRTDFDGQEYEDDLVSEQAYFYSSQERWAYSANGVFMGNGNAPFVASTPNVTGGDIYRTARVSPTSLRYFGLCMRKGSYKVRLHFAEISYTDDMTFSSLGRRYFDVSIQGVRYLKDFNIVEAANGVGKGIHRDFDNIIVNGSTIDIHLYWAGKGTTAIPDRGVYGPLISAITITPNFYVGTGGLSGGAIAGIVIGSCAFVGLILAVLWWRGYIGGDKEDKGKNNTQEIVYASWFLLISGKVGGGYMAPEYAMRGYLTDKADVYSFGVVALEIVSGKSNTNYRPKEEFVYLLDWDLKISLNFIRAATNNFGDNLIERGGFGDVFKGELIFKKNGARMVAFKRLNRRFGQGEVEFWKEVMLLSQFKHKNLVKLLYFCSEDNERILAYKYASRRSLDNYLGDASLTWTQRLDICIGAANGIACLHDPKTTQQRVLHRDIKSSNILLDYKWRAKVSDFGLSKVAPANQQHSYIVSNVVGTHGYCDPAYAQTRILSKESDMYSFGVVLFEIMCGKLSCTYDHYQRRLEQIEPKSLSTFSAIAHRCLNEHPKERPNMVEIVNEFDAAILRFKIPEPLYQAISDAAIVREPLRGTNRNDKRLEGLLHSKECGVNNLAMYYKLINELPSSCNHETALFNHVPKPPTPPNKRKKIKRKIRERKMVTYYDDVKFKEEEAWDWKDYISEHTNDEPEWIDFKIEDLEATNEHHDQDIQPNDEDNDFPNNDDDDYTTSTTSSPLQSQTLHTPSTISSRYVKELGSKNITQAVPVECKYYKLTSKYYFYVTIDAIEQGKPRVCEAAIECDRVNGARTLCKFVLPNPKTKSERSYHQVSNLYEEEERSSHQVSEYEKG
ncbi:LRR receptor-like serine/threonine-protein kinase [Artemisia annua]|uniref:non-specific serine/threonine protein kinase n=1 Tax=Artemisia annua TaxID=35608 RepID=A0A2U1MAC2_ARTAN|nr:LRR receptor-like serine/threonine-protein kinase [Artemisia annua]